MVILFFRLLCVMGSAMLTISAVADNAAQSLVGKQSLVFRLMRMPASRSAAPIIKPVMKNDALMGIVENFMLPKAAARDITRFMRNSDILKGRISIWEIKVKGINESATQTMPRIIP